MTQDEIIEMARQAGFPTDYNDKRLLHEKELKAFAKLVAAKEREACAKAIDEMHLYGFADVREFEIATLQDAAKAIRARAQADRGEQHE